VTGLAIPFQAMMRFAKRAGCPHRVSMKAFWSLLNTAIGRPCIDRPHQKCRQHQGYKAPCADPLARQQTLQGIKRALFAFFGGIRQSLDPLDGQDSVIAFMADRYDMAAKAKLCALEQINLGGHPVAAIHGELLARHAFNLYPAVIQFPDDRMVGADGEVGQMDRLLGAPADADLRVIKRIGTNNLSTVGSDSNLADYETHHLIPAYQ